MRTTPANPLFCAIDTPDIGRAEALVGAVRDSAGGIKIGKEFFVAHGPDGVRRLTGVGPGSAGGFAEASGLPLFLDLKFHDIPNTVAGAVRSACALAPFMLNVHATGGPAMLRAAAEAAAASEARPLLIGVTVLTSLDDDDLAAVGIAGPVDERAVALARLSQQCGLDGVVCSAAEIEPIRQACGDDFKLVVPGIRPAGGDLADQKRVMTPAEALARGADYLVVGRPITGVDDPAAAARRIVEQMAA